jgi:hypothetical protein
MKFASKVLGKTINLKVVSKNIEKVYRNYATSIIHKDTLESLNISENAKKTVMSLINGTVEVNKAERKEVRPIAYGKASEIALGFDILAPFRQNISNFGGGRFGDGVSYGVLYTALEDETSKIETIHHLAIDAKDKFEHYSDDQITFDRAMITVSFQGKVLDVSTRNDIKKRLTAHDYRFCRELGEFTNNSGTDAILTPSARHKIGKCLPIFTIESVVTGSTKEIYRYSVTFNRTTPDTPEIKEISTYVVNLS